MNQTSISLRKFAHINAFIRLNNKSPKPFVWTKTADVILGKVRHRKAVIETLH